MAGSPSAKSRHTGRLSGSLRQRRVRLMDPTAFAKEPTNAALLQGTMLALIWVNDRPRHNV